MKCRPMKPLEERFNAKVDRSGGPNACWNWTASTSGRGYGQIGRGRFRAGNLLSHRVAWELANGPIPRGLFVLHRCDNPRCCNPAHLFLGTQADNMQDMIRKGRKAIVRVAGERHGMSRVTEAQVCAIRRLYREKKATQVELARRFRIGQQTVSQIVRGETWSHI